MRNETPIGLQLQGYRLATAEIFYRMPDHPGILQSYVWQDYDIAPRYPVLSRFLDFWSRELEGPLHSVRVAGRSIISAAEMRAGTIFQIH
ncbi:MAG: usg protein [Parvularculaceae bacterium]|nr:usg protein [Parvularculaceae bacterium]